MKRVIIALCCMLVCSGQAFAARNFVVSAYQYGPFKLVTLSCEGIGIAFKESGDRDVAPLKSCDDAALSAVIKSASGAGTIQVTLGTGALRAVTVQASGGDCQAGRDAGPVDAPIAYVDQVNTDIVLQVIRDPMTLKGSQGGCEIAASSVGGCFMYTSNQPALKECTVYFKETGVNAGGDAAPDTSKPAYTGGTTPGGGGGTTPGDGGGTTPGDGGGTTPGGGGTTPGGGGATPGDGGGGTTPGGGGSTPGTGGGDGEAHCGAPGQPACSINEGNTPTGIGGLLDGLMKLVDGLGEGRQSGIDDAKSDVGKNTDVPLFAIGIPRAECVNPSIAEPFSGRVWTIEICKYITMVSIAFEAFWIFAFAIAVMSLVSKATQKPVA